MVGTLLLSPQINTAKRLLEKGKEAQNNEPERSWFQTKEERKKEKSMLGGSSKAKHRIHRTQQFHSSKNCPKELKTGTQMDAYTLVFIEAVLTVVKG